MGSNHSVSALANGKQPFCAYLHWPIRSSLSEWTCIDQRKQQFAVGILANRTQALSAGLGQWEAALLTHWAAFPERVCQSRRQACGLLGLFIPPRDQRVHASCLFSLSGDWRMWARRTRVRSPAASYHRLALKPAACPPLDRVVWAREREREVLPVGIVLLKHWKELMATSKKKKKKYI